MTYKKMVTNIIQGETMNYHFGEPHKELKFSLKDIEKAIAKIRKEGKYKDVPITITFSDNWLNDVFK